MLDKSTKSKTSKPSKKRVKYDLRPAELKKAKRDDKIFKVMSKAREIMARRESMEPSMPKMSQNNSILNIKTAHNQMPSKTPKNHQLKVVIKCEHKIEMAKIELARREDFNVFRYASSYLSTAYLRTSNIAQNHTLIVTKKVA